MGRLSALALSALLSLLPAPPARAAEAPALAHPSVGGEIDPGSVVETVSHYVRVARPGVLEARDRLYTARFDAHGFSIALRDDVVRFASGTGTWRAHDNVAERTIRPGVIERVTAREGALEWDVVLRHAPAGDLVLPARVTGARGARGDRLLLPGGRAVRFGEIVVRDGGGAELYRAPTLVRRDRVTVAVPHAVLARAAYPVTVDPVVSPEYPISDPVYGPAIAAEPAVASNGTISLVVWSDRRDGDADIWGARVDFPNGKPRVLDPGGISIGGGSYDEIEPDVVFEDPYFLVVWAEGIADGAGGDIVGAHVTLAGEYRDQTTLYAGSSDQRAPAIASLGPSRSILVWEDHRDPADGEGPPGIYVTNVITDASGNLTTGGATNLSHDFFGQPLTGKQITPDVASNGGNALVVWEAKDHVVPTGDPPPNDTYTNPGDLFIARVKDMSFGPATPIIVDGNYEAAAPVVTPSGGGFFLAWQVQHTVHAGPDPVGGTGWDVSGLWLTGQNASNSVGSVPPEPAPCPTPVSDCLPAALYDGELTMLSFPVSWGAGDQRAPAVLPASGGRVLVAWEDTRDDQGGARTAIYGAFVTEGLYAPGVPGVGTFSVYGGGALLPPGDFRISERGARPAAGPGGLVVWDGVANGPATGVAGARVIDGPPPSGEAAFTISGVPNDQNDSSIAYDGAGTYLVVWSDLRPGRNNDDIYGARVSDSGAILDAGGIAISTAANGQYEPDVVWNGSAFFVVWADDRSGTSSDIYGARVGSDGAVPAGDRAGIPVSAADLDQTAAAVAWSGSTGLVVWQDARNADTEHIFGARVSVSGPGLRILDANARAISALVGQQLGPDVATDGSDFVVVYNQEADIVAAHVRGATGTVDFGPAGVLGEPYVLAGQYLPAIAWSGSTYLVAWGDYRSGDAIELAIAPIAQSGASLNAAGTILPETVVDYYTAPALAWNGSSFVIAWMTNGYDVWAARATPSGVFIDSELSSLFSIHRGAAVPAMTAGPAGRVAITYQGNASDNTTWSRARMRFFDDPPNDDVGNATALTGTAGTLHVFSGGATKQPDEPEHAGRAGGASVWFRWTPPLAGGAGIDTMGSAFDSVLAVYSTTVATPQFSDLTLEAEDDNGGQNQGTSGSSLAVFEADPARTYYIAVDDVTAVGGRTALSWELTLQPNTAILTGPKPFEIETSATFSFARTRGTGFECSLNGAFQPCASPTTRRSLDEGTHTLAVRAVDGTVRDPTPARWTWTVDHSSPSVLLTSPNNGVYRDGQQIVPNGPAVVSIGPVSVSALATDGPDASGITSVCMLLDRAEVDCAPTQVGDEYRFGTLVATTGEHTVAVRVKDRAGNPPNTSEQRTVYVLIPPALP